MQISFALNVISETVFFLRMCETVKTCYELLSESWNNVDVATVLKFSFSFVWKKQNMIISFFFLYFFLSFFLSFFFSLFLHGSQCFIFAWLDKAFISAKVKNTNRQKNMFAKKQFWDLQFSFFVTLMSQLFYFQFFPKTWKYLHSLKLKVTRCHFCINMVWGKMWGTFWCVFLALVNTAWTQNTLQMSECVIESECVIKSVCV